MTMQEAEQAYRAVLEFLGGIWERTRQPGDLAFFCSIASYTPGVGTADPAMWSDWLAALKKVQDGVVLPDPERGSLPLDSLKPPEPEQAYLAMFSYVEEYWERISRPADIGDLLGQMRYTPGAGTADPSMWQRWLAAIDKVRAT